MYLSKAMYIMLAYLLSMQFDDVWCKPLKYNEQIKSKNTITEDSKTNNFWTLNQPERCRLLSKTLPSGFENQLDYWITLERKVNIST